jgi:MFS family permease
MVASQMLVTSLQPVFVLYVESLGVEPRLLSSTTGVLFAATGVTALVAAPRWGRRGDRLGFHGALTLAVFGSAVLLLLQGLVTSVALLLVLRLLYGGFVSGILPPLLGFISAASPPGRRGGLMGLSSSAIMLGNLLGPLAGGFVAGHLTVQAVFYASAAGMLCVNWYAYRLKPR